MQRVVIYIKVGGAVMSGAYSAYQLALLSSNGVPSDKSSWLAIGIAFAIFVAFVVWGWGEASWRLRQHENTHPKVKITPISDSKVAYLKIENKGHSKASFEVRVVKWEGLEHINHRMKYFYNARWELFDLNDPKRTDSELKAGSDNRVKILEDAGDASLPEDVTKYRNVSIPDSRAESFWQAKVKTNTIIRFTIQILSEPKLKKPFQQTYGLSINDYGVLQFKELA